MAIAASEAESSVSPGPAVVRLRDRWDILSDVPLPELRCPTAMAYAVEDHRSVGMSFFALVADPKQPIRGAALGLSRIAKNNHVLVPIEYGAVDWAPQQQRCLALICERPAGGRLAPVSDQPIMPWAEEDVADRILGGILPGLRALTIESMTHRGIRPSNIFFHDAARRQAMLGDCITALPAAYQPVVYEPIESAMTLPSSRGSGSSADDLYALGVLCLHLLHGMPPGHGLSDDALIEEKIKRGSFNTLATDIRLSPAMLELLRGLLIDEPEERWTLHDAELWLQGRRLTPKVTSPAKRASRPFEFGNEQYFTARNLGRALAGAAEQGIHTVRGNGLQMWLLRSLGDKSVAEAVEQALADGENPSGANAAQDARLVARVAIALDPAAPIRYRSLAVAIDGIGSALASAMLSGGNVKLVAEILLARLPQFWCQHQSPQHAEFQVKLREYDRLRRILEDQRPSMGIERLVYELNPNFPCLSPFVATAYVYTMADLLPALEQAAADGRIQTQPVDRHVAAFIANRAKKIDEAVMISVGSADPAARVLGMLQLLAEMQNEYGIVALPALSRIFAQQAQFLIDRFRNRRTRERLKQDLAVVVSEASLPKMLRFLDNTEEKQIDTFLFSKARHEFNKAARAIDRCEQERRQLPEEATQMASAAAAGLSMLIGVGAIAVSIFIFGSF